MKTDYAGALDRNAKMGPRSKMGAPHHLSIKQHEGGHMIEHHGPSHEVMASHKFPMHSGPAPQIPAGHPLQHIAQQMGMEHEVMGAESEQEPTAGGAAYFYGGRGGVLDGR